jgi:uncharacterized protein YndB with AHSA1/START domain
MSDYAKITSPDTVRLERILPGPIERVWTYLTEPDKRAKWFAGGPMELRPGGQATLVFDHANLSAEKTAPEKYRKHQGHSFNVRITACDAPRLLTYTWGDEGGKDGEVTFELTPQGKNVLLVLTHRRLPSRAEMRGVSGGWHSHLGILEDVLHGREPRGFWSTHAKVEAEYAKLFAD